MADLVDELSQAIGPEATPSADTAHLADSVAHLAQASTSDMRKESWQLPGTPGTGRHPRGD